MPYWTHERDMQVAKFLVEGLTAAEIGSRLGTSRNAIIGRVTRCRELREIGFVRSADFHAERAKKQADRLLLKSPVAIVANGRQYTMARRDTTRSAAAPRHRATVKPDRAPKLRIVSNNTSLLIQDWLERNGGARKFEREIRTDYWAVQSFLRDHGVNLNVHRNKYLLGNIGAKTRQVSWKEIMDTVDKLRCQIGLQPFRQHREA